VAGSDFGGLRQDFRLGLLAATGIINPLHHRWRAPIVSSVSKGATLLHMQSLPAGVDVLLSSVANREASARYSNWERLGMQHPPHSSSCSPRTPGFGFQCLIKSNAGRRSRARLAASRWLGSPSNVPVLVAVLAIACSSCVHKRIAEQSPPAPPPALGAVGVVDRSGSKVADRRQMEAARRATLTPLSALTATIPLSNLTWEWMGPAAIGQIPISYTNGQYIYIPNWEYAGRINGLAIDPHNDKIVYAATSSSGLWRTQDGGQHWAPLTDSQCSLHTSSITIDPSDSNTLYLGTGDADLGQRTCGLLKSSDGGATWSVALQFAIRVRRIIAIPAAAGTLLIVAADNGIYRSTDGAAPAAQVLDPYPGNSIGADVAVAPGNTQRLYASANISDSDVALFRSDDGGQTWQQIHDFDSGGGVLKLAIAVSPASADTLAVVVVRSQTEAEIQKSTDGGHTFVSVFGQGTNITFQGLPGNPSWAVDELCEAQCNYDSIVTFDASDANTIYAGFVSLYRTRDGGNTWTDIGYDANFETNMREIHADQHAFAFDSQGRLYIGCDGGVFRGTGFGSSYEVLNGNLGNLEFYDVTVGPSDPDNIIGGSQDNGTTAMGAAGWAAGISCDAFQVSLQSHVNTQTLILNSSFTPWIQRVDVSPTSSNPFNEPAATGLPTDFYGWLAGKGLYSRPGTLYYVSDKVYRTVDDGTSWQPVSPPLSNSTVFAAETAPSPGAESSMQWR